MKKPTIFILILMFVFQTALAIEENVVEPLATSAPTVAPNFVATDEYTPESISALYGEDDGYYTNPDFEHTQMPLFIKEERERFPEVLKMWESGQRPKENILNKTDDVVLGVYELRPEDYDGETAFLLMPVTVLTDEQILQIIDAYDQLGIKFNPSNLSFRNCARGGGIGTTRLYSDDERARVEVLVKLVKRQGLKSEKPLTPLPNDDGVGHINLNEDAYNGLPQFSFKPFRRMTDDELLYYITYGEKTSYDPQELNSLENIARKEFTRLFGMPLAISLDYESKGIAGDMNVWLEKVEVYTPQFNTPKENDAYTLYTGHVDVKTGKVLYGMIFKMDPKQKRSDLRGDPYDEKWQQIAKDYVESLRNDGVKVKSTEARGETDLQDDGKGVTVWLICEDGSFYEARISYQTEQVSDITYYSEPRDYTRYWEGY